MRLIRCFRLVGIALLVGVTTGGGCDDGPTGTPIGQEVILAVTLTNADTDENIHLFRDVVETFDPQNELTPGGSRTLPDFEVEGGDILSWVAGRDAVRIEDIRCMAGPASIGGARPRYLVEVEWDGFRLSCVGWEVVP